MKAIRKSDGKKINVNKVFVYDDKTGLYTKLIEYRDGNETYKIEDVELLPDDEPQEQKSEVDWEQRRYEIAKDAMCAYIASYSGNFFQSTPSSVVGVAIMYADELIKKLKGE